MKTEKWLKKHTKSLAGKVVAISGATGGIGRELCMYLAELGAALVLLDRNADKSAALERELKEKRPALTVTRITLDLENIDTVGAAADKLAEMPIDVLILNAGAYSIPRHPCSTGLDNVYQINFLSPYYLARRLLPQIKKRGGRIIAVGSIAHSYSKTDPLDIDFHTRKKASLCYGNAKRQLMLALWGMDESDTVTVTHPGITFTGITAHYPPLLFALIKHPMKVIFMKPKRACLSILAGIFASCRRHEWIGPRWFDVWGLPKKRTLHTFTEQETKDITARAEQMYRDLIKQFMNAQACL